MPPEVVRPSRIGTPAFLVIAVAIFAVLRFMPRTRRWAGFTVAFIDVPIICAIQIIQQSALPSPLLALPTNIALMFALIGFSSLSLSRGVIAATAVMAWASMAVIMYRADIAGAVQGLVFTGASGLAVVMITLVRRVARLAQASRQRDLLGKYVLGERIGI